MRSTSAGVLRFGLEGYIHVSAIRQCHRSTINASELVLNPNFPKQILRSSYRNLNFFWLVSKAGASQVCSRLRELSSKVYSFAI